MKRKTALSIILLLLVSGLHAQPPEGFNYQAVARDDSGQPLIEQEIGLQIGILKDTPEGERVYEETFDVESNAQGLIHVVIGSGQPVSGDFSAIDWSEGSYFVEVAMDTEGGTNYVTMGVTQLMSVPYSLHSLTSGNVFSGDYQDLDNAPDLDEFITLPSPESGDLAHYDGSEWNRLPIGEENQVLMVKTGQPQWTSVSFGDTDLLPPTVVIQSTGGVTYEAVTLHADVTDDGGANVTDKGIVWGEEANPGFDDNVVEEGDGTDEFSTTISGLEPETTYYFRAYATNGVGTSFSEEVSETTIAESDTTGTVTDIEGNTYNTVLIDDTWWMAENLRTRKYNDGTDIPTGFDEDEWVDLTFGAWAYFNDELQWDTIYGKLYNWFAVDDDRGLCPEGWRLPTDDEIIDLRDLYGGYSEAGGAFKETGTHEDGDGYWREPNAGATNETGFTARPGGARIHGVYFNRQTTSYFWTADDTGEEFARNYLMTYDEEHFLRHSYQKHYGLSVRCLKE